MRTLGFALLVTLVSACALDPSEKPDCLVDDDCRWREEGRGHCRDQVCHANVAPVGMPDVFYLPVGTELEVRVEGDVLANDTDADGDTLSVGTVTRISDSGYVTHAANEVEILVQELPLMHSYTLFDAFDGRHTDVPIYVRWLPPSTTVAVESGTSASLAPLLGTLVDTGPGSIELASAPTHGTLAGPIAELVYTPEPAFCGVDSASYRVHAANGTFEIALTLAVGLVLVDEQRAVDLGSASTIDVLANDRTGIELVSVDVPWASINAAKTALVVEPPTSSAQLHTISYVARDARGCEGTGTLTLDVGYPTRVVVGEGLTGDAFDAVQSHDGRFIAFTSADATLVANDTNSASDVFVLDLQTTALERVSVASNGAQANEGSSAPTISADGRFVAFVSRATNLAASDTTSVEDIYVHDRTTGATNHVSLSVDGAGSDQPSLTPHISSSGARIVFSSAASRLVSNDTNDVMDVFVRDTSAGTTTRVSVTGSGAQVPFASGLRPRISGNGRYVALSSSSSLDGSNASGAFLVDTAGRSVSRIGSSMGDVDIDDVGRFIIHASSRVTLTDRVVENTVELGMGSFPVLSADGRHAIFVDDSREHILAHAGSNSVAVPVVVTREGEPMVASPLRRPELSGDGRWVVFATDTWPDHVGRFVIVRVWNRGFSL